MTAVTVGQVVAEVSGEGFPVVMIHGLGGTMNMFQPQLAVLGGYRVVRLDLPGAGRSPRPLDAVTLETLSDAVIRAMHGLGVARAHFIGHSMGTMVCQRIAVGEPGLVASLSLFGALAEPAAPTREALLNRARLARSGGIADIADQIVAGALSAHTRETAPAAVAFVRESITRQDPEAYARHCEALSKAEAVDISRIAAPAMLVTGDADMVNPASVAQALADRIKGAVFSSIDRCGHWATIENPQASNRKLAEFLREVDRRG
ncbi:3-oxoadipate enol-lactonase [Mesorhizobium sp. L-8-10]|uniref:alpha/beta fold hydrolase n=1 Tax=unclassified Mesorhizobium TaxID=325217 RepID=UPI0019290959|nr:MULTISPECIES: alpha/beta fold hydrolase [unclassified Mesorhizobium]BCH23935.1 3-oxoadipate enol-lactonase [Mesorhizobium sp. L-8-3]BCH31673.1 3-oxoadipate enol-lactonase [Mesorhizobium sp. L-8-10]